MSNVQVLQEIYSAFGRGDVPTILKHLADDVQWESWDDNHAQHAGVPWLAARTGRGGVAEFFGVIGSWDVKEFAVVAIMDGGSKVAAEIAIDARLPTGTRLRDQEIHLWEFDEGGLVTRVRHFNDTAKHIAAAQQADGP